MGRGNVNRILIILIVLISIFAVGRLFVALLPYLLVGGFILWIVFKIKSSSKNKEREKEGTVSYGEKTYTENSFKHDTTGDVIDVDYEDV